MNHNHGHRLLLTLILPLLMLSFTACAGSGDQRSTSKPTTAASQGGIVETDGFIGMIFTADHISANTHWPGNDEPWTPSEADIIAFEEQLTGYLQEESPNLRAKLGEYTRQYWGTATQSGNRAVYANFFCDDHGLISDHDWRNDLVVILDGGDCYFQTLYDLEDGVFVWLAINGES